MPDEKGDNYFCDDDWSVWLRVETWVWAALLLTQLSMIAFVVIHGRNDKSFRQAFYVLFVAVTLIDCALVLLRPSPVQVDATLFGTKYDTPFIEQEGPWTHQMVPFATTRDTVNVVVVVAVVPALAHAQPLFLTAIAVNRFTAFAFPLKHASTWRSRTVVVVMALLAAMSVILGASALVAEAIRQVVRCWGATATQRLKRLCRITDWAYAWNIKLTPVYTLTFTSAMCCTVSFVLNIGSITMLIALRTSGRLQRKGPELQLFAHSLWMFLLQILLAFQDVVSIADTYIDADFPDSTEWLAGVKAAERRIDKDGDFHFLPGCKFAASYYFGDATALPMCSVWYRFLTGGLRLREDPDFSVRTLELCLFALSGSVFLLIISGNVRQAYFKFYFEWASLKKLRPLHSRVQVITETANRPT